MQLIARRNAGDGSTRAALGTIPIGRRGVATALLVVAGCLAIVAAPARAQVGTVSFENSGAPEAQESFLYGLAQLHNFQYREAAEAFRDAQRIDPDFAMAYWGEAMTYNHPIWLEQDSTAARAVLSRLGETPEARLAKAPTERERAYLGAVETLFRGEGRKESRDFEYAEAMRRLHEAYPDDPDAATLYGLAILGTAHSGRDVATYIRAASIVEPVFDEYPDHPGAAHYLIHSYDDPVHAPLGLRAARAYSRIAPDAAHAQHMTSHIFVAMGMWDDVVSANENARRVARANAMSRGAAPRGCGHYNFWLEYGYLQQDRAEDARSLLEECYQTASTSGRADGGDILDPDATARGSYASMLARYVLDAEAWTDQALAWTLPLDDLFPARLTWAFVNGYAAARRGELVTTEVSREAIAGARREMERYLEGSPTGGDANLGDAHRTRARILEMQLEAILHEARGETTAALATLEEAARLEDGLPLFFGPPFVDKPSRELLGEMLLEAGRPEEAEAAFRKALERTPGRVASVRGSERARAAAEASDGPRTEEDRILAVLHRFFDALAAKDSVAMTSTLLDRATLVSTVETPDGIIVAPMGVEGGLGYLAEPDRMLERMWDPRVTIHGTIAVVWTPYDFHLNGAFSHCGIDVFSLVRTDEGWRIASIVWTVEPTGCDPSPLGPPVP